MRIRAGQALLLAALLSLGACSVPQIVPAARLTDALLQNTAYRGIYDEPVQLSAGRYEGEPFVAGGASRPTVTLAPSATAYGDLTGDGVDEAAVILAESSGGSGTFIYLAVVGLEEGAARNLATTLLGDRVQVEGLAILDGQITLQARPGGPLAPECCSVDAPTQKWVLAGDELLLVEGEPIQSGE